MLSCNCDQMLLKQRSSCTRLDVLSFVINRPYCVVPNTCHMRRYDKVRPKVGVVIDTLLTKPLFAWQMAFTI